MRQVLAFAFCALMAAPLAAHDAGERGEAPERRDGGEAFLARLKENLSLSSAQEKKIKGILDKAKPEAEKIAEDMKALHKKMVDHKRRTMESIRETLDLEQKDKFDQMKSGMGGGQHVGMGGGMIGPGMGKVRPRGRGPGERELPEGPQGLPPGRPDHPKAPPPDEPQEGPKGEE